jgi:predicted RNA binding protein YcfA (HicA-like mRNA interferase family)
MSRFGAAKAGRVLAALLRIGWSIKRELGSHKILEREGWETRFLLSTVEMKSVQKCCPELLELQV